MFASDSQDLSIKSLFYRASFTARALRIILHQRSFLNPSSVRQISMSWMETHFIKRRISTCYNGWKYNTQLHWFHFTGSHQYLTGWIWYLTGSHLHLRPWGLSSDCPLHCKRRRLSRLLARSVCLPLALWSWQDKGCASLATIKLSTTLDWHLALTR